MLGFLHDAVERDGHSIEFFSAEQVPQRLQGRWARFTFPWLVWRHTVAAARAGRPYDVVNVHETSAAVLAFGKRAAGNPLLAITSHGSEVRGWEVAKEDARLGGNPLSWKTRLWYPISQLTQVQAGLRRADHIFCLNEEDGAYFRKEYHFPTEKITPLRPAAEPVYAAVYPRRRYDRGDCLLVFGTWMPRKRASDIVAAFTTLASRRPDLKILIMGAGMAPEKVRNDFPETLRVRVEIVPDGTPSAVYAERMLEASVYLIPSLFEGTPLTLMESMASGLPAVATATCGMKDVIADGVNGYLVPLRDPKTLAAAIERLLADSVLRERLGRQAHVDSGVNHTWADAAAPLREFYRRVANRRVRPIQESIP